MPAGGRTFAKLARPCGRPKGLRVRRNNDSRPFFFSPTLFLFRPRPKFAGIITAVASTLTSRQRLCRRTILTLSALLVATALFSQWRGWGYSFGHTLIVSEAGYVELSHWPNSTWGGVWEVPSRMLVNYLPWPSVRRFAPGFYLAQIPWAFTRNRPQRCVSAQKSSFLRHLH